MHENMFSRPSNIPGRSFHTKLKTKGFEPKIDPLKQTTNTITFPKKLEYVDDSYEIFKTPPGFKEMLDESLKHSHKVPVSQEKDEKKTDSPHRSIQSLHYQ